MTESPTPYVLDADTMTGGMRPIRQAVLAVGSNLGDRLRALQGALAVLEDTPEVTVVAVSSVYETEPVGISADAGKFLNAVVLIDTTLTVHTLLDRALAIEDAFGRERSEP
ncbi:MAG: 2-amino-4-hydroxy-6-hydroxymethyldihydropteridine diphosphokinase, partial [Propionibacteriales bacterium]|nr:2-amino-4-hydroxy-6-hydroxymethyldihydropteridine diphosphokinase [Propionibacteriales bacterium]